MVFHWPRPLFYVVLALVLGLDQATKAWVVASMHSLESITVISGVFNLTYIQNQGIAFGMFQGQGLLIALFMIVLAAAAFIYIRGINWAPLEPNLVGGLLVGGAAGNLLDRCRIGHVVDFFDFHWGMHHWPSFNVADSMICISVGWIVLRQFRGASSQTTSGAR